MIETTAPQAEFDAVFESMIAANLGGMAVRSQTEGTVPVMDHSEGRMPAGSFTESDIDTFVDQWQRGTLEGEDAAIFGNEQASDDALRAEEANRQRAVAYFAHEQHGRLSDSLRQLNTDEEEEEEEGGNRNRNNYRLAA